MPESQTTTIPETDATTLASLASHALRDADQDRVRARRLLGKRLRDDPEMMERLLEPIIEQALSDAIRVAVHKSNRAIGRSHSRPNADDASGIKASTWYTYALPNGVVLGQAKRDDLLAGADAHESDAKGNMRKATWLRAIAKQVGAKRVADALGEIAIGRLWEATK